MLDFAIDNCVNKNITEERGIEMISIAPYISVDKRNEDVRQWLTELQFVWQALNAATQAIPVVGGDGALLDAIHERYAIQLPFFGINRGTCGFLLNPIGTKEELVKALESFDDWRLIELQMLRIKLKLLDGSIKEIFAFNDFFVKALSGEISGVVRGEHFPEQTFRGDGLIVSTPQGSTAYNKSAGGSILPLGKGLMAVTSICSAIADLRLVVSGQQIEIDVDGDLSIFCADRFKSTGCVSATITPDGPKVDLAFLLDYDFESRRYRPRFK
ncbi:MAG: NAD(+)/NADH kinase [Candidatus Buchananbacteria bacterium]